MHRRPSFFLFAFLALAACFWLGCSPGADSPPGADNDSPAAESDASGAVANDGTVNDGSATSPGGVVNVYTARHYDSDDQVYAAFTDATGIEVRVIDGDSGALLERLRREGAQSPADVFMAVDAGRLYQAEQEGIFAPTRSEILEERIPANLRHPDGLWFGLTKRARVLVYAKDRVEPDEITTYEQLADEKWKDRVLIRSSSNIYNQSLVGSILAAHGEEQTEQWCRALVENMARKPQGGDRDQVRALAAGEGDVAVVNSYYLGLMLAGSDADRAAAESVGVVFPNQDDRGTHVNISGAGLVKNGPNPENAVRFLEFLTSPRAQEIFATGNKEYPVVEGYAVAPELATFGPFREDSINASIFGANNQKALMVMDRCGWR